MGNVGSVSSTQVIGNSMLSTNDVPIDYVVRRFWDLEQFPNARTLSPDGKLAVVLYSSGTARTESDKYIVELPFCPFFLFDGSRDVALKSFHLLEQRLLRNSALYAQATWK